MALIREHLTRRVLEVTASCGRSAGSLSFCLAKDRQVAVKLPLALWKEVIPNSRMIPDLLAMKPDETFKSVSYSKDDDSLLFALNEQMFLSETLSQPGVLPVNANRMKLVVDFSSPNVAKPFHMGHLRSTIVGHFVANVLQLKNDVVRLNYLGDWGTQFGFVQKGLEMLNVDDDEFHKDPLGVLYKAYVTSYNTPNMIDEARSVFTKLENGEDSLIKNWDKIKRATYENLRNTYNLLGIKFDEFKFESDYRASNIKSVIDGLIKLNIARYVDGQLVTDVRGHQVPLLRKDDSTLYLMRDVAAALDRLTKYNCDKIVYVVDKSQERHFENLSSILDRVGHRGVVRFCPFGRVVGMSTRKGTSVFLSSILAECIDKMAEQQKASKNTRATDDETTRILGLTCLQIYILKHGRTRDFSFDWNQALLSSGDSGVKLQYTHSRLTSLEHSFNFAPPSDVDYSSLNDPTILPLVVEMARVDEIVQNAVQNLESAPVVAHLFKLCNLTSRVLKNVHVKGQEESVAQCRLLLFHKARTTIKTCMELIGLQTLKRM